MTSAPHDTSDNTIPAIRFAAFQAFFDAERPALTEALLQDLLEHKTYYQQLPEEERLHVINENLDDVLQAFYDPQSMATFTSSQSYQQLAQGIDLDQIILIILVYRQQILNVMIRAIKANVALAEEVLALLTKAIDQRTRLVVALYEQQLSRYKALVDSLPDAAATSSLDGKIIQTNAAFYKLLGYDGSDVVIGMHYSDYIVDSNPEAVKAIMEHGIWQGYSMFKRKDGSTFPGYSSSFIIRRVDGEPLAMGGVIHDVTDELRTEEALERQTEELRTFYALAENAPDSVMVMKSDGVISYANPAMHSMLAYQQPLAGLPFSEHLAADLEHHTDMLQQIMSDGTWSGMLKLRRQDSSIVQCQASSFLIKGADDSKVIASIIRDVTEQQQAAQERQILQDQLIMAQQMALRELSTPLIPITDGVVAMPLIGSINSERAQTAVEELLRGVDANRASTAIIDITGVPVVDTHVAGALVRAAQSVELLGAQVIITGIRPEVAQTLVGIGVNLGSIITRSTLQDGISYAMARRKRGSS